MNIIPFINVEYLLTSCNLWPNSMREQLKPVVLKTVELKDQDKIVLKANFASLGLSKFLSKNQNQEFCVESFLKKLKNCWQGLGTTIQTSSFRKKCAWNVEFKQNSYCFSVCARCHYCNEKPSLAFCKDFPFAKKTHSCSADSVNQVMGR